MDTKQVTFIDYYEVLGIWPTADDATIKKAYFKLAKLYHPDIVGSNGDETQSNIDFKLINEAFSVLSDPVKRREFDTTLKKKGGADNERKDEDRRSATLAYEQGRVAMKHGRYDKAAVLLRSAVKYDDTNAAYHSWYGFCLAVLKSHLHEARDACRKALELEFYNADYHANLGFVYYQAGLTSTADESFKEALKWDSEHPIASKYYGGGAQKEKSGGFKAELQKRLDTLFGFLRGGSKPSGKPKTQPRGKGASRSKSGRR